MKKINLYITGLLFLSLAYSCNDAIEITQPGRFSADNAFQSVEDLSLGLLGTYNQLDITDQISFNSTFTDEISIGFDNGGQGLGDGTFGYILNSTSRIPLQTWIDQYDAINASTRLIEAAPLITPTAAEQDNYNNILGQAYAIRAYAHFVLYAYYTTDYTDDSVLSVIAVDFVPEVDQELGRNTAGEVVALINSDLARADELLSDDTSDPTFINKDFVTALRARMAAYRQEYASAATLAASLTAKYPLADTAQYFAMFDDADNTEVIFKLERSIADDYDTQAIQGGGWAGSCYAFVSATKEGGPFFEMSRSLYNAMDEDDVRLRRMIDPSSEPDPDYATNPNFRLEDILVIRKYPGSDGQPLLNDLKIFRASEMVLIQAEAAAASGDLAGAAGFIKQIRDARYASDQPMPNYSSESAAYRGIMDERRIELALEAHRYLDLKRLGARAGVTVDRDPLDCQINNSCTFSISDHRWTLPIPQDELNANTVIREQQNPGY